MKATLKVLDKTLADLQARVTVLRDRSISKTKSTVTDMNKLVEEVSDTIKVVNSNASNTLGGIQKIQEEMKDSHFVADHTNIQVSSTAEDVSFLKTIQQIANVKLDEIRSAQNATDSKIEELTDVQRVQAEAARAMALAVKTAEWKDVAGRDIRRLKRHVRRLEAARNGLSPSELIEILAVSPETAMNDYIQTHRACQSMGQPESVLARGIIQTLRFTAWSTHDAADALFIEGGSSMSTHGRYASLSLISCLAIAKMDGQGPAKAVRFFCRRHVSSRDPLYGPQGMLRSLISQVLQLTTTVDLGFTAFGQYRQNLENCDIRCLCECFTKIIKQLPPEMVLVCVIDSIDSFEKHEWAEECRFIFNELQEVVQGDDGPVFKLLVTCPARSRYVGHVFPAKYRMLLSGSGFSSRDDPTARQMALGSRRERARESSAFRALRNEFSAEVDDTDSSLSDSDFSWTSDPR